VLNRRGWDLFVAAAQERIDALGDRAAILVIDLDGLKAVNDGQGHHAGDALLASAAAALQQAAGERDIVARYGGDEFAVYVDGLDGLDGGDGVDDSDPAALAAVARAYARALAVAGVSASIGVAPVLAGDGPGTAVQRAFAEADAAMYADKVRRRADAVPPGGPR
jgi:diguanylate cyclase (GGDEF)-like protein